MSAVDVVGEMLVNFDPLLALVSAAQIKAGALPAGTPLPAISVTAISRTERGTLVRGGTIRASGRAQVTAIARSMAEKDAIMPLLRRACLGRIGSFAGVTEVSVQDGGEGPDLSDERAGLFMQPQDFRVSYNEPA